MPRKAVYFAVPVLLSLAGSISLVGSRGEAQKSQTAMPSLTASPVLGQTPPAAASAKSHTLFDEFGRVPVFFVPNRGQTDNRVGFYVQGADKTIYFASDGLTLALSYPGRSGSSDEPKRWTVKLDFLGARGDVMPEGVGKTGATISYFRGKPEEWETGLPAYSKIVYRDLWPGIDLAYKGEMDKLKYEFIVHPGADPSKIRLAYRGAEDVSLTEAGRLSVKTPAGAFEDDIPVAYQAEGDRRTAVPVAYALDKAAEVRSTAYSFALGPYDRSRTLIIDPAVLVYCGYIGGAKDDGGKSIAVDGSGNVYITGRAFSAASTFPVTAGPDLTANTGTDAFVAKVDASGTNLIYCGYLGSASPWDDSGIAVDGSGNAFVTGFTSSNQSSFPVKVGPDLTHNGSLDAFVAKVNPSGTDLVYCGYIGGSSEDTCLGIAVDDLGRAYVSGNTFSSQATFPVKVGPDLTYNGDMDAFVARVNASGTGLDYCGYIGGSGGELASGIAIDGACRIYVSGHTSSSAATFPVKVGPSLIYTGGGYVAKVEASGVGLVYCGYIAGTWWTSIAVDGTGSAYVTGSANEDLPVTVGPDLTFNGGIDAFVAKVEPSGASLLYCGYIGGADDDSGWGIAVDGTGHAYVVGNTASTEASFPVVNGPDLSYNGGGDGFIAKVDPSGTALIDCGYIGGSDNDGCEDVAVDDLGNAYLVGRTVSTEATFPVVNGPDLTYNGGGDTFVAKLTDIPGPPITSLLPDSADAGDPDILLSVIGSDFADGAVVRWGGSARPTTFIGGSELQAQITAADLAAGKTVQVTVRNPNGGISNALQFTIDNPLPTLTSVSPTQVTGGGTAFMLTVQGSSFVPNSVVRWNGSARTTTYVSATELQAAILSSDLATGGEVQVTVYNPAPSGGETTALAVQVSSFTLSSTPTSATVTAGQSATYTVQVTPQNGSFDAAVSFQCVGLPSKCTAAFSPISVTPGAAAVTTTLTLTTTASASAAGASIIGTVGFGPLFTGLFATSLLLLLTGAVRRSVSRHPLRRWLVACAIICLVIVIGSCSAGGGDDIDNGTPKGTHTISVQGTSGNMTVPTSITLVVN